MCIPWPDRATAHTRLLNQWNGVSGELQRNANALADSLDPGENATSIVYEDACILFEVAVDGLETDAELFGSRLHFCEVVILFLCHRICRVLSTVDIAHLHPPPWSLKLTMRLLERALLSCTRHRGYARLARMRASAPDDRNALRVSATGLADAESEIRNAEAMGQDTSSMEYMLAFVEARSRPVQTHESGPAQHSS